MTVADASPQLTLGPVLFNWAPERWRDFYFRIADEAPVSVVYLGEVVCSKRAPLYDDQIEPVAERLARAGKTAVFSTLSEVILKLDRRLIDDVAAGRPLVEANDAAALAHLRGRPHHIGALMNVYNEQALAVLAGRGACSFCLPAEMPARAIEAMCERAAALGAAVEVQVFGRVSLALSARCYHARAHGRTKDTCQFVCENDPDGLELRTLDGSPFLTVNGIQVLSRDYLNLVHELPALRGMGVSRFRLWPQWCDMVSVAAVFRSVLDGRTAPAEGAAQLAAMKLPAAFANGFYHGRAGHAWVQPAPTAASPAQQNA